MNVYHPKVTAWLWLLGMLFIGFLGSQSLTKDWLETGFLALLPVTEQKPEIAKAVRQHNEQLNRKVIWLTGALTSKDAIAHAQQLKQQLQQSGLFGELMLELPQQTMVKQYQQLFSYRYQLLDAQTRLTLDNNPKDLLAQNLETLYSPIGQMTAADLEHDPLLLFSRYFNAQNPLKLTVEQGIVILHDADQFWALLLTDLEDQYLQLDKLETLLALVNSSTAQTQAAGGDLMVTGMPLFTAQGSDSARQEISTVGLGSSAGIVVLLLLTFRSLRPLLLSFLAIGSGLFAALVVSVLFFGKIHIITLVFGASLIGVADDYAIHFVCDSFGAKNWLPRQGLRYIFPGLVIGLLTNLLSYAGLVVSPFPGLQEVALFSAVGLLVAWLTVVLLFPLLLTGFKPDHQPLILVCANYWQQHWPVWLLKNRHWLIPFLLVFIAGGLWQLTPRDDVRLLQSAPAELLKTADKIKQLLPVSQENQFFLVSGHDINDWHQHEQQLLERLNLLTQQHKLMAYQGLSGYWPDEANQQTNYRLLDKILYQSGLLKQYMMELGFSGQAINTELKQFSEAKNRSISLPEWLVTADETKQQLWLGCDVERCLSRVVLTGITDLPSLAALQSLQGVAWVDQVEQLSSLFARYRLSVSLLLIVAYLLVFSGLGLKFGWHNALKITAIPVVAALVSLAMMGWFDQLFSLFNLFALLLVLGIGVDDAIFFFMADSSAALSNETVHDRRASTSLAVTLSALTTLLAFGLLAVSSTEIVHAFGFTVATGILTALVLSPLVGHRTQGSWEIKPS
ncbi:MMPL family transporter [Methylobacter sp. S3L5C]|uniref:MMPL family transporter n=1 Tax=Methylobacter sp. S3L5C TaxID=2839024 RepID=UPI001FACD123|nr:MMPL family transporter [Methylobacter sp. S3L5C]